MFDYKQKELAEAPNSDLEAGTSSKRKMKLAMTTSQLRERRIKHRFSRFQQAVHGESAHVK
jgi:hypothetical protein